MVKKQHYVPRFYLNYFCSNDGFLYRLEKRNSKVEQKHPKNVAYENHFYDSIESEIGSDTEQYIEKMLSSFESKWAK